MKKLRERIARTVRRIRIIVGHVKRDLSWMLRQKTFAGQIDSYRRKHWVFLVGCNNSGTTILHDLLRDTGYFAYMDHEGQRYTQVLRMAERKGHERVWTEYLHDLRKTEDSPTDNVGRLVHDWTYELHNKEQHLTLEKTTANALRTRWLQAAFPRTSFIRVVRNGYAVTEGIRRKGGKSLSRAARHWQLANEILDRDSEKLNSQIEIRYEDLVAKPIETMQIIGNFLGFAELSLKDRFDVSHLENMNGNSIDALSEEDIHTVRAEAESMLRKKGYV